MRKLLIAIAVLCALPAALASAQTGCLPPGASPVAHAYLTERPVPYSAYVSYAGPLTPRPAVMAPVPVPGYQFLGSQAPAGPAATYRPVVPAPSNYVIGRGIIGQPKLYVPGQPIRNALRWLTL